MFKWFIRNPLHNFTFYVIGFADRKIITSEGVWPKNNKKILFTFRKIDSSSIKLPFFSFKLKRIKGYIGWRERGNFGVELRFYHD